MDGNVGVKREAAPCMFISMYDMGWFRRHIVMEANGTRQRLVHDCQPVMISSSRPFDANQVVMFSAVIVDAPEPKSGQEKKPGDDRALMAALSLAGTANTARSIPLCGEDTLALLLLLARLLPLF